MSDDNTSSGTLKGLAVAGAVGLGLAFAGVGYYAYARWVYDPPVQGESGRFVFAADTPPFVSPL